MHALSVHSSIHIQMIIQDARRSMRASDIIPAQLPSMQYPSKHEFRRCSHERQQTATMDSIRAADDLLQLQYERQCIAVSQTRRNQYSRSGIYNRLIHTPHIDFPFGVCREILQPIHIINNIIFHHIKAKQPNTHRIGKCVISDNKSRSNFHSDGIQQIPVDQ